MALDFQQVYKKIKEIGANAAQRKKVLEERHKEALTLLNTYASELDVLRDKVDSAKQADPSIRCALPLNENLDSHIPPPDLPLNATLIAADGSQINPDRHGQVQFGLVNVGAIVMRLNSGATSDIYTYSDLLFDEELLDKNGVPMSEAMVALRRDLQERSQLEELAGQYEPPVVTFTDGPVELWGAKDGEDAAAYEEGIKKYIGVLSRLQTKGITTAGYVDKPASDLVMRLLELAKATPEDLQKLRSYHPLLGVTDRWLFGDKKDPLLRPGERSAVFALQSRAEKYYKGVLALHFFYLNAGIDGRPWPVRVEIPKWVADDPEKLSSLHAILVQQCRVMGTKPYPYLLHRAHETAVVSNEEKFQVEQMLLQELRRTDGDVDEGSYKQSAKDLSGRTSYK